MPATTTPRTGRPELTYRASGNNQPAPLSTLRGIGLIFRRELLSRLLSKAFLASMAVLAALSFFSPYLFGSEGQQQDPAAASQPVSYLMLALAVGLSIVLIIMLWGATLATGVVDEKASRVVEILLACIRPWQLLIGKVLAVSLLGLTQIAALAAAALAGLAASGNPIPMPDLTNPVIPAALISLVSGVVLFSILMAALAARVARQEDLSSVLQPAYLLSLGPFAAAVILAFNSPSSPWLDVASIAPFFNVFAMPVRMAIETVPLWQQGLALLVCLATIAASSALSGRIYGNAILRSGGKVALRDSLAAS
ncbi:ABC transporter permease [Microbacterium sp.]|uniref:ABC transporter permease n=1 Tax=Microbacterium sp. TaxID=51671 RepID=UPI003F9B2C30